MPLIAIILPTYVCPLACTYCYNEGERQGVMTLETMRTVVTQIHEYACAHPELGGVRYLWHGGEPMVAGVKFYEEAIALQKSLEWTVPYSNAMQSNGLLLDEEWTALFKEQKFVVSFSLDGTKELNDMTRVDHKGRGSFERIVQAYRRCTDEGLSPGLVLTITSNNAPHAAEIYRWFAQEQIPFSVLPLLNAGNARANMENLSLKPAEYLKAWITMYDLWLDIEPYTYVTNFVAETRAVITGRPYMCTGLASCADSTIAIEPDGSVYPCGSLTANPLHCYGSLRERPLSELMCSNNAIALRNRQHAPDCLKCKWFHTCHGGCMSRAYKYKGVIDVKDYYCEALYGIFEHVEQRMSERGIRAAAPHSLHLDQNLTLRLAPQRTSKRQTIIPIRAHF